MNLLIGVTGSVATIKIFDILECLKTEATQQEIQDLNVKLVSTASALKFFDPSTLPKNVTLYKDDDEWQDWGHLGDPILHIHLRKWADIFVIAPLDANTLGKITHGLCDNLLTCIIRAWPIARMGQIMVCPAMNTYMWDHPLTPPQLEILKTWGVHIVPPISKHLACGDFGLGALAHVEVIVMNIFELFKKTNKSLPGESSRIY